MGLLDEDYFGGDSDFAMARKVAGWGPKAQVERLTHGRL